MVERQTVELPIEIHEHILGFLDNWKDAGTIARCALVCRRWLPFSRFKLYFIVELRNRQQWTSFKHLVLESTSNVVGYLGRVRDLRILPEGLFGEERLQPLTGWGKGQERPWAHLVLVQCTTRLTGLTHIHLSDIDWTYYQDFTIRCGSYYLSLTTLVLCNCTFSNVLQLHLFVTAFPSLRHLSLVGIKLRSLKVPSRVPEGGHPLTQLELDCEDDVTALVSRFLASAQLMRNLPGPQLVVSKRQLV